jgi:hypothetical protein
VVEGGTSVGWSGWDSWDRTYGTNATKAWCALLAPRYELLDSSSCFLQRCQRYALDDTGLDPVDIQFQCLIRGFEERVRTIRESDLQVSWALS